MRRRDRSAILTALLLGAALIAAPSAAAMGTYDLTGTWNTYSLSGGGYTGTFQITNMNLATGAFSGTGNSGSFALQGTESGSAVTFTQSSGGYVATDRATLQTTSTGLEMVNGNWSDTNGHGGTFYASVVSPLRPSHTAVACVAGATPTAPLSCTVTTSDASSSPPSVPSGQVTISTTHGTISSPSCTLAATNASSAACTITLTPPTDVGYHSAPPLLSATYSGDAGFATSSGQLGTDCVSGLIFQLSGITSTVASPNGFHVGAPAVLHGCGLTAATQARFGANNAQTKVTLASDAAANGTSLTLTVPQLALTGQLTVTDASTGTSRTAALATPDPVEIDSWRNTEGLPFDNFKGSLSVADFLAEFPNSQLTVPGASGAAPILKPWVARLVGLAQQAVVNGLCYGFAMTSGMFADGTLNPTQFDPVAHKAILLAASPQMTQWLEMKWAAQYSDAARQSWLHAATRKTRAGLLADLTAAMPGGDGWSTPAIIGIYGRGNFSTQLEGHAEIAYGWAPTPKPGDSGAITIYTADSNYAFHPAEDTDQSGATHAAALQKSWITVDSVGNWVAPGEGLHGSAPNLSVTPISTLEGTLTLNRPATFRLPQFSVLLGPSDRIESFAGPSGSPVRLTGPSPGVTPIPQIIASGAHARPAAHSIGTGGISQVLTNSPTTTLSLNAGTQPLTALWTGPGHDAALSAGAGHLRANWHAANGQLAVTPIARETAPGEVTLTLVNRLSGDQVERVLTVSGPPALQASLGTAARIASTRAGTVRITLSITGRGVGAQSVQLGAVHLSAGQALNVTPRNWTALATTRFAASLSRPRGGVQSLSLRAVGHMPTGVVSAITLQGRRLGLRIRVPALLVGQSEVRVTALVRAHGNVSSQIASTVRAGGPAHVATVTLRLRRTIARGAQLQITVITVNGGTMPSRTVSSLTRAG